MPSEIRCLIGFQTAFDDNRGQLIRLFAQFDNFRAVFVDFLLIHAVDFRQFRQILRRRAAMARRVTLLHI